MNNTDFYYVAKQPILDVSLGTYGYELLFRSEPGHSEAIFDDPDMATVSVINYGFIKSQEKIKQHKKIFINFTERLLLEGAPRALPPAVVVIELLESISNSQHVIDEIIKYKQEGYLIALDDYIGTNSSSSYLDFADIIKIDVLDKSEAEVSKILSTVKDKRALKLAEKVSDGKAYRSLQKLGFDLFQGYFFARPENLSGKKVNSSQLIKIKALSVLQNPNIEINELVDLISIDPPITYRLLRLLNSAAYGFSMKIESVKHAVVLLGMRRVKYWLQIALLSEMSGQEQPTELFHLALTRGKTLEELGNEGMFNEHQPSSLFLFGLLSLMDIMLDRPFEEIFKELPLTEDLKTGYLDGETSLSKALKLLVDIENNDADAVRSFCKINETLPKILYESSIRAHTWSESIVEAIQNGEC